MLPNARSRPKTELTLLEPNKPQTRERYKKQTKVMWTAENDKTASRPNLSRKIRKQPMLWENKYQSMAS